MGGAMQVSTYSPEGHHVDNLQDIWLHESKMEVVVKFAQFYTLQIVRFYVELFMHLEAKASSVPRFSEILRIFYNSDDYLLERKVWELQ